MAIFNSYVKLPEGNIFQRGWNHQPDKFANWKVGLSSFLL